MLLQNTSGEIKSKKYKIRDFSEPLQYQRDTTAYSQRLFFMPYDVDASINILDLAKYETEKIKIWRMMAKNPYIDFAIDDIVNEMVSTEDDAVFPVDIDLSTTTFSENIREKIHNEFINVMKYLQFNKKSYFLLRNWYIDARAYFFIDIDTESKKELKIKDVIPLDPLRTFKEIVRKDDGTDETIFYYRDVDLNNIIYTIPASNMIEVNSGLMDEYHRIWISYLDKAYIPMNQVTSIEDALVIYRLSRAPERRVFYVDVGELPKAKAEQYMRELINNYRNTMQFDSETGTIKEKSRHMSLLDDIWLPRRGSGTGTEVSTLQGGTNLGETSDIDYFLKKLFRSLNVPFSRFNTDISGAAANVLGRTTEISRDEVKYGKFISRLRSQYNTVFYVLLRFILDGKNIIKAHELDEERDKINFIWNTDNMFEEFKKLDVFTEKMNVLERLSNFVGVYVSKEWIRKEILGQNDEEIEEIKKQIEKEKKEEPAMPEEEEQ